MIKSIERELLNTKTAGRRKTGWQPGMPRSAPTMFNNESNRNNDYPVEQPCNQLKFDPCLGEHEAVRIESESGTYSFRAAVAHHRGLVVVSPVPERVSPGRSVGYGISLKCESAENGTYIWADHDVMPAGTQIVRLRPFNGGGGR